jgi:conjugative relaxase-like TrwC/TraI family protein
VLTVAKITTQAAGGYADYLEGKATVSPLGDYYLKDGERVEAPGRWVTGSPAIGCDPRAAVSGDALRELMAVRRPDNGQPLRKTGSSGEAVAAIDATFSAPKSVSAIWALGGPGLRQRIEQAHEQAISRSVQYAIQQVRMIRERIGPGTVVHALAADVVASSWRHTTARSVGERLPDPQLHSHVLLHGAVRQDGRLVAIDSRSWLVHRRELGAAYRTELAHRLSELGFEIQRGTGRGGRYFEIAGVPSQLTDRWSSRHHQVRLAIQQRLIAKRAWLLDGAQTAGTDPREVAEQRAALASIHR